MAARRLSTQDERNSRSAIRSVDSLLQRTEKRKQDFADLQDADIHRFFETLGYRVVADKLRREKCAEQIAVRLTRDQAATLRGKLPASETNQAAKRATMKRRARHPLAHHEARKHKRHHSPVAKPNA